MRNPIGALLGALVMAAGVIAVVTGATTSPVAAANEDGATYYFEVVAGNSPDAIGVVTATVAGDMIEVDVAADNLGVDAVVMHFHPGSSCDAGGGVVVQVPAGGAAQASPGGSIRLSTTQSLGDADMENVYFNIHKAGDLSNIVACASAANGSRGTFGGQPDQAPAMLSTVADVVGDTVRTTVSSTGLNRDSVIMHFHAGAACDGGGGIVLGVDGDPVASPGGALETTFVLPKPATGFDDLANVYFNVHDADDLSNVLVCGTLLSQDAPAPAPGLVAEATTIEEIINASDYDPATDPEILRLYQAFFNREPDVGGAIYWIGLRDQFSALAISRAFPGASAEFQNTYADAPSDEDFLNRVYENMLGREAEATGFAYWIDILKGTNASGQNPDMTRGDRGSVVFYVAINQEFVNAFPYLRQDSAE